MEIRLHSIKLPGTRMRPLITTIFICFFCNCNDQQSITPTITQKRNPTQENKEAEDPIFLKHRIDLKKNDLRLFWKDSSNQPLKNFDNLKTWLNKQNRQLVFAMNGGMYQTDNSPLGLYVENSKLITPLNKRSGEGNFYLKPNGVFYITKDKKAFIETTAEFKLKPNIEYATQSGPMLLVNGNIHSAFKQNSVNTNIRNGVGILPDGQALFVMSKQPVNFYDFANYFKKAGCQQALYLNGFVSRTYLPSQNWIQTDGDFGVMIAEITAR